MMLTFHWKKVDIPFTFSIQLDDTTVLVAVPVNLHCRRLNSMMSTSYVSDFFFLFRSCTGTRGKHSSEKGAAGILPGRF